MWRTGCFGIVNEIKLIIRRDPGCTVVRYPGMASSKGEKIVTKMKRFLMYSVSVFILAGLLLTGCGGGAYRQVRIMWAGSSNSGRMEYRYKTFTGVERKNERLEAGDTLAFEYDATVDKGTLTLQIQDPDDASLWEATLRESAEDRVDLTAEQTGTYTIVVEGDDTGGEFEVSWEVE